MTGKLIGAHVDPMLCVGSTMCVMHMPDAFRIREDGHAEFIGTTEDQLALEDVVELCPVSAITLIYED